MNQYLPIIISAAAVCLAAYQYVRNGHKEIDTQMTAIMIKLETIAEGIIEIKNDLKNVKNEVQNLRERMAKVEASASSAHKRIDNVVGMEKDR
ncbi:MAG: hypothetical protein IKF99_10310 [Oscillospiraceae bacterium]|nr:hypothetical protein [Oscillospiraceae bacterium]